jgi:hypothetical protein
MSALTLNDIAKIFWTWVLDDLINKAPWQYRKCKIKVNLKLLWEEKEIKRQLQKPLGPPLSNPSKELINKGVRQRLV